MTIAEDDPFALPWKQRREVLPVSPPVHVMLNRDLEAKTGECKACGLVTLKVRGDGRPYTECPTAIANRQRRAAKGTHGLRRDEARGRLDGAICELCSEPATVNDHDHETSQLRGTLCRDHNLMLGMAKDSPEALRAGADYVEKYRALANARA